MIRWRAEFRYVWRDDAASEWAPVAKARKTMESARGDCRGALLAQQQNRDKLEFRIVTADEARTVCQESKPPHADRLRWTDIQFVRREAA